MATRRSSPAACATWASAPSTSGAAGLAKDTDVDQISASLKLAGKDRATLVITRVDDKPWGIICTEPS